jgi:hypothetical protein
VPSGRLAWTLLDRRDGWDTVAHPCPRPSEITRTQLVNTGDSPKAQRHQALTRLESALSAAQSVQAELPGSFSTDHDRDVMAYVDGEISAAELYRRTVERYRR